MNYDKSGVLSVAESIREKINELEEERVKLVDMAQEKATAISQYDKVIAITTLKLKNKAIDNFEGQSTLNLPATLIPQVAKGMCYKERFDQEAMDGIYKATITNIEAIKAELNGFQSINRHLDNV